MRIRSFIVFMLLLVMFLPAAHARQIRVYVAEFKIVGAEHSGEMNGLLPDLLGSRLNVWPIMIVETRDEADIVVAGRYTLAGTLFSIDAVASNTAGKFVARVYEEGEAKGQLLPTVGKLASKLAAQIMAARSSKMATQEPLTSAGKQVGGTGRSPVDITDESSGSSAVVTRWLSQRLPGSYNGIAPGRRVESGERELFVVSGHALKLFRQGKELQQIAEVSFPVDDQILGIDSADLDGDGNPEAYVTIFNGDALISQIWVVRGRSLVKIADRLPYYFRSITLDGRKGVLYAQEISLRADFFGEVREVVKDGAVYTLKNPLKLPRGAMLYNFNHFRDGSGNSLYVVLSDEGHLVVHAADGEELWRSKESYGGTELFFKRKDLSDVKYGSEPYRRVFLRQRIFVTQDGDIVVPQNFGTWNTGNSRTYDSSRMVGLRWNGSSLEKRWQTPENEAYLADYYYDPSGDGLVNLEVVKHEGMFSKGASIVSIRMIR